MKKFLSVALSLVMLATSATNLDVASAVAPNSGQNYDVYLTSTQRQTKKLEAKKQKNNNQNASLVAGAVIAGVCAVGGVSLLGYRAMQNKKLDATKLQDNWNNPNKTTIQKYLDAVRILIFGDPARKAIEKAEEERNRANQTVNNLEEERKAAETVKDAAEKAKTEAENKKNDIDKSVDLIKNGGNDVKSLETLKNEEKIAIETSVNATNARKEAEKELYKATKDQKEADRKLKITDTQLKVRVAQFNETDKNLNDANAKLTEAQKNYKDTCKQNGWSYNAETDKCESPALCGPNEFRDEKGVCVSIAKEEPKTETKPKPEPEPY